MNSMFLSSIVLFILLAVSIAVYLISQTYQSVGTHTKPETFYVITDQYKLKYLGVDQDTNILKYFSDINDPSVLKLYEFSKDNNLLLPSIETQNLSQVLFRRKSLSADAIKLYNSINGKAIDSVKLTYMDDDTKASYFFIIKL
jgi:hypothetical protein